MDKSSKKDLRLKAEFFLTRVKQFWIIILIVTILGASAGGVLSAIKYNPEYTATQVFSIELKNTNVKSESITNTQLSKTVPALFSSDAFMDFIQPYINKENCSGKFRVASISSTNIFCIYVVAPSNKDCLSIIEIFKNHYSEMADEIIGPSSLNYFVQPSTNSLPSNSPNYAKFIIIGAIIGLALMLAIIYMKTILSDPITSQDDAEKFINSQCLTTIKTIKTKKRSGDKAKSTHKMPLVNDNECPLELKQSISSLATKVEIWCKEKNINTIMFTSTISGEGKSSIALNTAIELASKGNKVLIVDGDLRSPSITKYYGLSSNSNNLTKLINKEVEIDDAIEKLNEVYILSNNDVDENAFENVTSSNFCKLVNSVKSQFDYVIIDTPPVGMLGDAISISDCADAYIYVISFNYVAKSSVLQGLHSLTGSNSQIIGFILNYEK